MYEISTLGNCRRIGQKTLLAKEMTRKYVRYCLRVNGRRKKLFAHRMVLLAHVGPRPEGHVTRHLDGVPTNNNVKNLVWGTYKENTADMARHGTMLYGTRHKLAKLTKRDVRAIRRKAGKVTQVELAAQYGVSQTLIFDVIHRVAWRHVE